MLCRGISKSLPNHKSVQEVAETCFTYKDKWKGIICSIFIACSNPSLFSYYNEKSLQREEEIHSAPWFLPQTLVLTLQASLKICHKYGQDTEICTAHITALLIWCYTIVTDSSWTVLVSNDYFFFFNFWPF